MDTIEAIDYCEKNNIEGCFVECGVFSGTQEIKICNYILDNNCKPRDIYMYDTFSGLVQPDDNDFTIPNNKSNVRYNVNQTRHIWETHKEKCGENWYECSLEQVKINVENTNYPKSFLHYIKGDVLNTLKNDIPFKIAILRLDTDWYKSSKFELEKLYPNVVKNGVIILDDYYLWNGQQKATDEYLKENNIDKKIIQKKDRPQIGQFLK